MYKPGLKLYKQHVCTLKLFLLVAIVLVVPTDH